MRDPFDGTGIFDLAAHGGIFRDRCRAVPPHSPDAGPLVHSLRRSRRSLPAPGLRAAGSDAGRAARDVAGDGADLSAMARLWRPAASAWRRLLALSAAHL